ncbi:hypothetical protein CH253_08305 [Rhodococcus sp. 06-156-3C]|uniref:hypothetical protein n=1 Tax=Rhodococcus sp. 06-156-3C TaxID=2022486 RepID=UPI000B9C321D|nr:hypothetical protein [Rhodococcus sp. 06-156-3C]OZD23848.1 hypothetical protein CH253_08305 [Rhodococcus sp. 06-156-3C]
MTHVGNATIEITPVINEAEIESAAEKIAERVTELVREKLAGVEVRGGSVSPIRSNYPFRIPPYTYREAFGRPFVADAPKPIGMPEPEPVKPRAFGASAVIASDVSKLVDAEGYVLKRYPANEDGRVWGFEEKRGHLAAGTRFATDETLTDVGRWCVKPVLPLTEVLPESESESEPEPVKPEPRVFVKGDAEPVGVYAVMRDGMRWVKAVNGKWTSFGNRADSPMITFDDLTRYADVTEALDYTPEPVVWHDTNDIPKGVKFEDCDGDVYVKGEGTEVLEDGIATDLLEGGEYEPYTEVIASK